jgi:ABC-type multidrug transport system fused ATPase/permease subunit
MITANLYSRLSDENIDFKNTVIKIGMIWTFIVTMQSIKSYFQTKIVSDFTCFMNKKFFENYVRNNEIIFDDSERSADLQLILSLTGNMKTVFVWFTTFFLPTVIMMLCINIYFLIRFPKIGAIILIGNIINVFFMLSCSKEMLVMSNERDKAFFAQSSKLEDNLTNMMNIFLNDKVDDMIKENVKAETIYTDIYRRQEKYTNSFIRNVKILNYGIGITSMITLYNTTPNHQDFVKGLFMFTFYLNTIEPMLYDVADILKNIHNIKRRFKKLNGAADNLHPQEILIKKTLPSFSGHITFKDISFSYPKKPENLVFSSFSLDIPSKDKIAIVAQSGSGKSTLIKILLGFYPIQKGEILLDDVNIKEYNIKDVRRRINYINQRTLLFPETIISNMKYGNHRTTEEIVDFLKKYDLLKIFCKDGSNCLEKSVEKEGLNMSTGMQKVIYLVRGILKEDVDVYIFDEPLTSIDPSTRKLVLEMIKNETKGKTLIIITHDVEVMSIVDRKIELKAKDVKDEKDKKDEKIEKE